MSIEGNHFIPGLKIYLDGGSGNGGVAPDVSDDEWKKKLAQIKADHPSIPVVVKDYNPPEPEPPPSVASLPKPQKSTGGGGTFVSHVSEALDDKNGG